MDNSKILNRIAKVLIVVYAIFLSLFSLDAFTGSAPWYMELGGFLIHLIPTYIIIALAVLAWRNAKMGGIAIIVFGIIFTLYYSIYDLATFMMLAFPLFLTGALFWLSSKKQNA